MRVQGIHSRECLTNQNSKNRARKQLTEKLGLITVFRGTNSDSTISST